MVKSSKIMDKIFQSVENNVKSSLKSSITDLYNKLYGVNSHDIVHKLISHDANKELANSKVNNNNTTVNNKLINPSGVDQDGVGDCFFEAALASLANTKNGQELIRNMIKSNSNNSFTVTFPGDKTHPVTVTIKDLEQNYKNGNIGNSAIWADIIETAFFKYDHIGQYKSNFFESIQSEKIPILGDIVSSSKALHLLTDKNVAMDSMGFLDNDNRELTLGNISKANLAKSLNQTLNIDHMPVTAGASTGFLTYLGEHSSGPLIGDHVYSVLSFDPKTNTVIVRNPWGMNDGTVFANSGVTKYGITSLNDGKLKMSLDTFDKYFTDVNLTGQNPYINDFKNIWNDTINSITPFKNGVDNLFDKKYKTSEHDFYKFLDSQVQMISEETYLLTDTSERALKSIIGSASDYSYTLCKDYWKALKQAYKGVENL